MESKISFNLNQTLNSEIRLMEDEIRKLERNLEEIRNVGKRSSPGRNSDLNGVRRRTPSTERNFNGRRRTSVREPRRNVGPNDQNETSRPLEYRSKLWMFNPTKRELESLVKKE